MAEHKVEISQKTIIFTLSLILGLWALYQVRSIVILVFIAFLLMTAVNPLIRLGAKVKLPAIIIMLFVYFGLIAILSTVAASLIPAVIEQTKGLSQFVPGYLHSLEDMLNTEFDPSVIAGYFNTIPTSLLKFAAGTLSNLIDILALFFISYYLVIERPSLHKYLLKLFPEKEAEVKAEALVHAVEKAVGGWVRGEIILMLIIGGLTYFGLVLLGIPYALPLAVLAGTLEVVPNIGPIIAAIPAIFMGFTVSPFAGLGALVMSVLIQQMENNLIVPRVMESATGIKPLITILILMVGYTLGGIQGAILGIPLFLAVTTIYKHLK